MRTIFTPQQAKTARAAAQLSQGRVSVELGINRTYLSQFESGKYLLDDATLARLRDYYAEKGVDLDAAPPPRAASHPDPINAAAQHIAGGDDVEPNAPRLRDGFLLPFDADDDESDALLTEYAENRRRIADLCARDLDRFRFLGIFLDDDAVNESAADVLALMARNFSIVEVLQGHDAVWPSSDEDAKRGAKTIGDVVRARLPKS